MYGLLTGVAFLLTYFGLDYAIPDIPSKSYILLAATGSVSYIGGIITGYFGAKK